jgi:hypothetical protein
LKPELFLPPLVALAIAGAWLGSQRHSISSLEEQSRVLQQAIASRKTGELAEGAPASLTKPQNGKEPLDWKKIAASLGEMLRGGGMGDMRSRMKLQQRVIAMSKEELIRSLDEIAALDLSKEARDRLEQMLIMPLGQKDPEYVLNQYTARLEDEQSSYSGYLTYILKEWAEKDPASASAWFDRQIAAGKFDSKSLDGKSQTRLQFEGNLINTLLSSDPEAAGRRLAALPEDQRKEALSQSHYALKEEDQVAYAKLVRDRLTEKEQTQALAQKASSMVGDEGFVKVTEFLDRIKATPAERTACVERAAESQLRTLSYQKKVTRSDIDTMREWVSAQAPASISTVTGKALANAAGNGEKMEFSEAAELALEYNTATGNDDVLATFLYGYPARQNQEQARVLAEKITDPKRRAEILKKIE